MDFLGLENIPSSHPLERFSKQELIVRHDLLERELKELIKENYALRDQKISHEQVLLIVNEQLDAIQRDLFGSRSEKMPAVVVTTSEGSVAEEAVKVKQKQPPKPRVKKPSERYPSLPIREVIVASEVAPSCPCCGVEMSDSGMTEDSEQLTVIPKKYEIILQKRVKYRCGCQGAIVTTPAPARIIEGSSYSDEMIQDVALTKYCDLVPIERQAAMAAREGAVDLPPQSLIELTHGLADFVSPAYVELKKEVLNSKVVHADETPHRMLEGSEKKNWYLWGFSTKSAIVLECRNTRSGDVASEFLLKSRCEVLVTDVYSGYGKAIREANRLRPQSSQIRSAYCNAHARRYFFQARENYPEAEYYLHRYQEIYAIEASVKGQPPPEILRARDRERELFEKMRQRVQGDLAACSVKSSFAKALRYFHDHYAGLTFFTLDAAIPIDNNPAERLLRSPVVGRKTWYGTHSQRGALTAAILFSIVESCKLNEVNPRKYFKSLTEDLLQGIKPKTPAQFKA